MNLTPPILQIKNLKPKHLRNWSRSLVSREAKAEAPSPNNFSVKRSHTIKTKCWKCLRSQWSAFSSAYLCSDAQSCQTLRPHVRLLYPWGFSRQEYWIGLPCPPPGDHPNPGIEPTSLMSPALAGGFFTTEPPGKPVYPNLFLDVWRLDQAQPLDIEDGPGQ